MLDLRKWPLIFPSCGYWFDVVRTTASMRLRLTAAR